MLTTRTESQRPPAKAEWFPPRRITGKIERQLKGRSYAEELFVIRWALEYIGQYNMELKELVKESYFYTKNGMLLKGDCLDWMSKIPNKSIDMILCDLPYGTTECKWDVIIPFDKLWEQYERIIKDNGAIVLTASQPFTSALVMSKPNLFRYELIWEKERPTNFMLGKKQPLKYHENICVFYKNQPTYNPQLEKKPEKNKRNNKPRALTNEVYGIIEGTKYSERVTEGGVKDWNYPSSIQYFSMQRGLHPTQKPVPLFEYLIKTYTNEGDLVLDNCSGSGTTAIACENLNRRWICIEKEEKYCEATVNRLLEINNNSEKIYQKLPENHPALAGG